MATLDTYYWNNPVSVIDQNQWTTYHPEVALMFRNRPVYTPLVDWTNEPQSTGGLTNVQTELLEPDVNADEIPLTATGIDAPDNSSHGSLHPTSHAIAPVLRVAYPR